MKREVPVLTPWKPMACSFGVDAVARKAVTRSRWCGRAGTPLGRRVVLACSVDAGHERQWECSDEA